mgnify:CR=1 FL=1|jgi:hypothetical protein
MSILAIVSTVVLSCTLTLLCRKVRHARNEASNLWCACGRVRIQHDLEMSVYRDDNLTLEEKYKKLYIY